jgi:hypothetical protein
MQVPEEDRAQYVQDFAASCEQFGMPPLSGGIVGALLVYEPYETSAAGLQGNGHSRTSSRIQETA